MCTQIYVQFIGENVGASDFELHTSDFELRTLDFIEDYFINYCKNHFANKGLR